MSQPVAVLRITRSQQMAMLDVIGRYMRLKDEPQRFCNVENDEITETPDLMTLVMDAPWVQGSEWEAQERRAIEEAGKAS